MKQFVIIIISVLVFSASLYAEDYKNLNENGVKAYNNQNYDSSLVYFKEAQNLNPEDKVIDFNLGNALHQQGDYEGAIENYEKSTIVPDSALASEAYYNMGNTHFRAGAYDKAVKSYKNALKYNPEDMDSKYNLELAMKHLEEQQQQQQQNQDQQDQKDQEEKEDQEKQDNQDQQDKNQEQNQEDQKEQEQKDQKQDQNKDEQEKQDQNKQEQEQEQQDDQQEEQEQKQQDQGDEDKKDSEQQPQNQNSSEQQPQQLDKQRAQALLDGLKEDEKDVIKNLIKQKVNVSQYKGKSW